MLRDLQAEIGYERARRKSGQLTPGETKWGWTEVTDVSLTGAFPDTALLVCGYYSKNEQVRYESRFPLWEERAPGQYGEHALSMPSLIMAMLDEWAETDAPFLSAPH
jgi:hypothetical protein